MINHNLLMYELFDRKFSINYGNTDWVVNYAEGDLYELAQNLNEIAQGSEPKYPIIWLQDGYTVQRNKMKGTVKLLGCKVFFITVAVNVNERNKLRYAKTYNDFLYKLLIKFDKVIDKTPGIMTQLEDDFRTYPLNEAASELLEDQKLTIQDVWDAVQLTTDIEITNECFPHLKINL